MKIIAHIRSDFPEKFGIPRQSGLADNISEIVFEKQYRIREALRGIEQFSHLWLIWKFSQNEGKKWSPTVRPPRLGGNRRIGVFATRSPFRPNPIGLSCVELICVKETEDGPVLVVKGADLLDNTPIFDIKPYLPYVDSVPCANGGFSDEKKDYSLIVNCDKDLLKQMTEEDQKVLFEILSQDARPQYIEDKDRIYGMRFKNFEIRFRVDDKELFVKEILKME